MSSFAWAAATQDLAGHACVGPRGLGSTKGYPAVRHPGRAGRDAATAQAVWAVAEQLTQADGRDPAPVARAVAGAATARPGRVAR